MGRLIVENVLTLNHKMTNNEAGKKEEAKDD